MSKFYVDVPFARREVLINRGRVLLQVEAETSGQAIEIAKQKLTAWENYETVENNDMDFDILDGKMEVEELGDLNPDWSEVYVEQR